MQPQPQQLSSLGASEQAEAASPISSRPPATSLNFDELELADHDQLGGSSSGGGGNRWPRQETLALLKIRSEMDVAFRDATLKGPLWDEVSRKLSELGYVRSAKKCKEKFENVHKYYKRTKEARAGKTYRFFTQLEAMQPQPPPPPAAAAAADSITTAHQQQQIVMASGPPTTITTTTVAAPPVQFATPISLGTTVGGVLQPFTMYSTTSAHVSASAQLPASGAAAQPVGISFSSDSASSDSDDDDMMSEEDQEEEELENRPASSNHPKRKRSSSGSGSWKAGKRGRMMDFFEGLMKQVMQKQEAMQQKFLETIEKREHDRLMREEAWKQHEATRLSREQQLAAQERAMAASRDAAIISFLHKITGQTIQLPPQPQPQPQPVVFTSTTSPVVHQVVAPALTTPASATVQSRQQQLNQPQNNTELVIRQQQIISQMPPPPPVVSSSEVIMAIPERQIPPSSQAGQELTSSSAGEAASSSRWPKAEVLALIKLRSNLENQYQEAGPKGPLWEEISAGMQRMGYNRSSKRCKEKWENINKYFKKVKESNKKRPEDAKTCPYFNELDALYQRKKLGGSSSSSSSSMMVQIQQQQQQQQPQDPLGVSREGSTPTAAPPPPPRSSSNIVPGSSSVVQLQQQGSVVLAAQVEPVSSERASDGTVNDPVQPSNIGGSRKPEDILMEQKQLDLEEANSNNDQQKMDDELCDNNSEDEDDEDDNQSEKERKMGYKIDQFQRPTNNKNGGTSNSSSFNITMVQ